MKILKKIIQLNLVAIMIFTLTNNSQINTYANTNLNPSSKNAINVAVFFFKFDDPFMSLVKQSLENIQQKNEKEVNFTFYDGKGNRAIQDENIDSALKENYDVLLVNLPDTRESVVTDIVNKAKQKNKPLVFFDAVPLVIPPIVKTYNKVIFVATDAKQSGILQGQILVNLWNTDKSILDKNNDNILEYVMLQGERDCTSALAQTKYSISTINDAGISTKELEFEVPNWDRETAKNIVDALFLRFDDKIEAIISNNDVMALGAIDALQKYGYNKGDKSKYIAVVGIDGIPEARDLVDKGIMAGTVVRYPNELAQALYAVGKNLANNVDPLDNTNYKFDESGNTIRLPYYEYKK